ncbi:hypothetical protein LZ32DRAFT_30035 [Colletotrichum eremochloae]|nr:hypothetical protein LZ32DRAFT_30035 [Colletotrichum eremochloae]
MDDATSELPGSRAKKLIKNRSRKGGANEGERGEALRKSKTSRMVFVFNRDERALSALCSCHCYCCCPVCPCFMALMDLLDKRTSLAAPHGRKHLKKGRQGKVGGNNPQPFPPSNAHKGCPYPMGARFVSCSRKGTDRTLPFAYISRQVCKSSFMGQA